jgi:outer membrane receptor protein involved in Fe transport
MKTRYLMSVACAAMIGGTAQAQTAPAPTQVADAGNTGVVDIIVTATRRSESIQKVPLTIQAFSGDTLKQLNVANFDDLVKFTPNVTFGNNGPGAGAIFMRGLSTGFAGSQSASTTAYFPNVALYLDDQSMQFPARNADVYVADMERIEVLEGPQGTLFGGGAEAGAVRYITNKPKLDKFEGHFEGSAGGTASGGAPNGSFNATINIPIIEDKLAIRAVIYDDHQGGYISNVPGTYTRTVNDHYANYLGTPTPTNQSNAGQYNNASAVAKNYNPVDYIGGRISAKWQIDKDWDVLISEMYQKLDAEGTFNQEPYSPDGVALGKLQTVTFEPSYNKDEFYNTAWTVNGAVGDFHLVYTGAYMVRHIETQQDYTNYSRAFGEYYQCTGSGTGIGKGTPYCYAPYSYWHDKVRNTHLTQELRVSTPVDKPIRVIGGAFYEKFRIYDNMDFDYKTTPVCTTELIATDTGCLGLVQTNPNSTANYPGVRGPNTAFGEDTQRGYDQYAFFGSADVDILHNLTLTAGTRYYHYKEFETGSQYETTAASCAEVLVCSYTGGGDININANDDHTVYHGFKSRVSLSYKPTTDTMFFGTFSQGFRPGGFNRTAKGILPGANGVDQYEVQNAYAPDKLTNWELGLKTDLFDRMVQLNLTGYYMIWDGVQFGFFDPAGGYGNTTFVLNGANYHVKGVEAQLTVRPVTGLSVQGSATYNDSKQVTSPCLISNIVGSQSFGGCITERGTSNSPVQPPFGATGSPLPFAPHFQGNLRVRYDWTGQAQLKYWAGAGVSYTGPTYNEPATFPSGAGVLPSLGTYPGSTVLRYEMPGYATVDAQIGIARDAWTASIFGKNLTNSNASQFTSSAQFIKSEVVLRPLTYGIKLTYDF